MPEQPAVVDIPAHIYRVARKDSLLRFSSISPEDARLSSAGNRFDVPGGVVLYAASTVDACFAETLARFRVTPKMHQVIGELEEGFMATGTIPQDWRLQRAIGTLRTGQVLPFVDLEDPQTHEHLSRVLANEVVALGYDANLDFSDVCNRDRRLSRSIASWAYTEQDQTGTALYGGIKYASRIDPRWHNWAIFDPSCVELESRRAIELDDEDFQSVVTKWGLHPF